MQGIEVKQEGKVITITITIPERGRPSASGKSEVLATTGGAYTTPGGEKLNLSLYRTKG